MRRTNRKREPHRQRSDAGFSVVEMLIVFAVLGIAMIPMASIQFQSRREITEADRMSLATDLAISQLENLKVGGFEAAIDDTLEVDGFTVMAAAVPDTTNPFLREVTIRVAWPSAGGERDVRVTTMQSALR